VMTFPVSGTDGFILLIYVNKKRENMI